MGVYFSGDVEKVLCGKSNVKGVLLADNRGLCLAAQVIAILRESSWQTIRAFFLLTR